MGNLFNSSKQKVKRGGEHLLELSQCFEKFKVVNPPTIKVEDNTETRSKVIKVVFAQRLPNNFAAVLGDAIHNLRVVLDYATWELIGIDGGKAASRYSVSRRCR